MSIATRALRATCAVVLFAAASIASAEESAELRALRARVEQQGVELEQLRAAVERLARTEEAAKSASASISASTSAPAPAPAAPPAPAPVIAGTGAIRFNGLLQGWFASGDAGFQDTFRVRRAELKFTGDLGRSVGWTVMIDPSKSLSLSTSGPVVSVNQAGRPLQDAFLTVGRSSRVLLTAGQFKLPLSREGLDSSAALDTVERVLFISDRGRGGAYGDIRDVGVSLRRTIPNRYDAAIAVFNGTGESQNETDRNERKALTARFSAYVPGISGLQLGASGAWGGGTGGARRDRAGLDALFTRGAWKVKSEVMTGRDGALDRLGGYVHAGYRVSPRLELVGRVDQWDPDTGSEATEASARERDYIAGANLFVTESLRLQANYVRKTFASPSAADRNLILINLQTSW